MKQPRAIIWFIIMTLLGDVDLWMFGEVFLERKLTVRNVNCFRSRNRLEADGAESRDDYNLYSVVFTGLTKLHVFMICYNISKQHFSCVRTVRYGTVHDADADRTTRFSWSTSRLSPLDQPVL